MNLYGPHIHKPGMGLDLLERGQFATALAMDVDSTYVGEVWQRSPGTILVVRVYEDGAQFLEWTPEAWVGRLLAKFPEEKPDYFVTINEPFGHDSVELFERFDIWESEVIRLLQANGTDGLACNFGTGNFTAGADRVRIPDAFPRICAIANAMGMHDYSWPTLEAGWSWYAGRWFQWYDDIKEATGREVKFLVGECGLTQAIIEGRPDHGWQSESPENVTAEFYLATLRWYLEQVVNWDAGRGIVLGLCLFNWYDQFHWSFEHIDKPEVVDTIIAMDVTVPPPEPPPNGGEDVRVFDKFGNELLGTEAEEMVALHSLSWEMPPALSVGDRYFKLTELREKPAASLITKALDLYGDPIVNPDEWMDRTLAHRALWWPTITGDVGHPIETRYSTDHHSQADLGGLNANGEGGSGMGKGAYHDPYTPGPHECWVRHPDVWSMLVKGQGMLGATDHLHLDMLFEETVYMGNGGEPTPPTPPNGALLDEVKKIGEDVAVMRVDLAAIKSHLLKTPPEPPEPPTDTDFFGEYFDNVELGGAPVFTRTDESINFAWGSSSPDPSVTPNYFSAKWVAKKTFSEGLYRFSAHVDDGIRIWVDDVLVLDKWVDQPPTTYRVDVNMTAGQHIIRIEYYERAGGATCEVDWHKVA